ncbi:MAG TPA: peptide-methionine (R)-S-oxide reductase MsrB [Ignavibacteria bacterium]|nr:peptide-methionine (R)-S-oxide reductase MsrB [Ignavibacteria bacterium]HQY53103.1 peptide-methionine (R)-S-oxide reductase MsrB [Ignavibacteria bacterium]
MTEKINKSEEDWKKELTPEQYHVTREKGTERPFTGKYYTLDDDGIYKCICCGNLLFDSKAKFDSGCGWPSYTEPLNEDSVIYEEDTSHGMVRTEVRCAKCDAHLGHVFDDGPGPEGARFCINSVSIDFEKNADSEK